MPTLGPNVYKYYLHWAIWIPRETYKQSFSGYDVTQVLALEPHPDSTTELWSKTVTCELQCPKTIKFPKINITSHQPRPVFLTILHLHPQTELLVPELQTSKKGPIAKLREIPSLFCFRATPGNSGEVS